MSGYPTSLSPRAPSEAPTWAARLVQDLVDWVYAIRRGPQVLTVYTIATLPDPSKFRGGQICVSDETGGFTVAFSDAVNWRRVQDRAIVS